MNIQARTHCRVLVSHHEPLIAAGLVAALETTAGMSVSARDPAHPFAMAATDSDVVVCDPLALQDAAGAFGGARLVVLGERSREFDIRRAFAHGALGYISKDCTLGELVDAVRAAARGQRYLCRSSALELASCLAKAPLTAREREALQRVAHGHANERIAGELGISSAPIKIHLRSAMRKPGAQSGTEVARMVPARGFPPPAQRPETSVVRRHAPGRQARSTMRAMRAYQQ
jgi:DNA-binding NarL/FixJ family response regulator